MFSVCLQLGALLRRLVTHTWAASGGSPELRPWPEVSDQQGAPQANGSLPCTLRVMKTRAFA